MPPQRLKRLFKWHMRLPCAATWRSCNGRASLARRPNRALACRSCAGRGQFGCSLCSNAHLEPRYAGPRFRPHNVAHDGAAHRAAEPHFSVRRPEGRRPLPGRGHAARLRRPAAVSSTTWPQRRRERRRRGGAWSIPSRRGASAASPRSPRCAPARGCRGANARAISTRRSPGRARSPGPIANRIVAIGWSHGGWTIMDALALRSGEEMRARDGARAILPDEPLRGPGRRRCSSIPMRASARMPAGANGASRRAASPIVARARLHRRLRRARALERQRARGAPIEILLFENATHAFEDQHAEDPRVRYNPAATAREHDAAARDDRRALADSARPSALNSAAISISLANVHGPCASSSANAERARCAGWPSEAIHLRAASSAQAVVGVLRRRADRARRRLRRASAALRRNPPPRGARPGDPSAVRASCSWRHRAAHRGRTRRRSRNAAVDAGWIGQSRAAREVGDVERQRQRRQQRRFAARDLPARRDRSEQRGATSTRSRSMALRSSHNRRALRAHRLAIDARRHRGWSAASRSRSRRCARDRWSSGAARRRRAGAARSARPPGPCCRAR